MSPQEPPLHLSIPKAKRQRDSAPKTQSTTTSTKSSSKNEHKSKESNSSPPKTKQSSAAKHTYDQYDKWNKFDYGSDDD